MFYVYLLQSQKDNSYYIGQTNNKDARLKKHNSGQVTSTKHKAPWVLIGFEEHQSRDAARWREYNLKKNFADKKKFILKFISSRSLTDKA